MTDTLSVINTHTPLPLTPEEQARFSGLERLIATQRRAFLSVGAALISVRDEKLYRGAYPTFEAYCQEKWDLGRAHSYRLIEGVLVYRRLSPIGENVPKPANEAQLRELAKLHSDDIIPAWVQIVKAAGVNSITAKLVRSEVTKLLPGKTAESTDCKSRKSPKCFFARTPVTEEFCSLLLANQVTTLVDIQHSAIAIPTTITYVAMPELANPFEGLPDWQSRYQRLLDCAGELLTERLQAIPTPFCLISSTHTPNECHLSLLARFLNKQGWKASELQPPNSAL